MSIDDCEYKNRICDTGDSFIITEQPGKELFAMSMAPSFGTPGEVLAYLIFNLSISGILCEYGEDLILITYAPMGDITYWITATDSHLVFQSGSSFGNHYGVDITLYYR